MKFFNIICSSVSVINIDDSMIHVSDPIETEEKASYES